MSLNQMWESLGLPYQVSLVIVLLGLPAATYYPVMFLRVQWWKSDIGKSMLMKGFSLSLVFWTAIGSVLAFMYSWKSFPWVQAGVDCFLVGAVWYQVIVLNRVQKEGDTSLRRRLEKKRNGVTMATDPNSQVDPTPTPAEVKDDPTKPYKAIVSAVVAALTAVVAKGADQLPWWALLIIFGAIAGLSTFIVPNPKTLLRR